MLKKSGPKRLVSKHLGEAPGEDAYFLEDCIDDGCDSAGETQAELAAEPLATTKANDN